MNHAERNDDLRVSHIGNFWKDTMTLVAKRPAEIAKKLKKGYNYESNNNGRWCWKQDAAVN